MRQAPTPATARQPIAEIYKIASNASAHDCLGWDCSRCQNSYIAELAEQSVNQHDALKAELAEVKAKHRAMTELELKACDELERLKAEVETLIKSRDMATATQATKINELKAEVERLRGALKPFAEIQECGIGCSVGDDEEHTDRCYECLHILAARAALKGGGK